MAQGLFNQTMQGDMGMRGQDLNQQGEMLKARSSAANTALGAAGLNMQAQQGNRDAELRRQQMEQDAMMRQLGMQYSSMG